MILKRRGVGCCAHPPFSMLGCCLAGAGFMHALPTTVNSHIKLRQWVWKILFLHNHATCDSYKLPHHLA